MQKKKKKKKEIMEGMETERKKDERMSIKTSNCTKISSFIIVYI